MRFEHLRMRDLLQLISENPHPALLPGSPSQPAHKVEMGVADHDRHRMLPAQRCDPNVVRRNRLTSSLQFQPDSRVVPSSLNANIEDGASVQHSLQRPFVRIAVARLRDTKSELTGYNDGDRKFPHLR